MDDWAKRKGQNYGTILVDLERGEIVDLLGDRTAETLSAWLREHRGIEVVARDRSPTYADAIQQGAPEAIQVAYRWHLLKNLSDVVFKILQQEYGPIRKQLAGEAESEQSRVGQAEVTRTGPTVAPEVLTLAEQLREERIERGRHLHQQGWTQQAIADHLNVHPKTVSRYLQMPSPQTRRHRTGHLLDAFKPYIVKRWNDGNHNAALLCREIQRQGFAGKTTIVRDYVQQLSKASGLPPGIRR